MNEPRRSSTFADLGQFLDGCASLDRDVETLLRQAWTVSSRRQLIAMAFCKAALELPLASAC